MVSSEFFLEYYRLVVYQKFISIDHSLRFIFNRGIDNKKTMVKTRRVRKTINS